jgi:hypothetical protein
MIPESAVLKRCAVALLLALPVGSMLSAQQWQADEAGKQASIGNEEGYRFIVQSSGGGARCSISLPEGESETMGADTALYFTVTGGEAFRVVPWGPETPDYDDMGDFMELSRRRGRVLPLMGTNEGTISFQCWQPLRFQSSPTWGLVRETLEGQRLEMKLQVNEERSRETTFSLEGAPAAISESLGIPPSPTDDDLLQDYLLTFRFEYRRSTCHLILGKKRRKRCFADVNSCGESRQESLVSMLGCIEGE